MSAMAKSIVIGMFAMSGVVDGYSYSAKMEIPSHSLKDIDMNDDNILTFSEFKEWLDKVGLKLDEEELKLNEEAIKTADLDKNGGVNLNDDEEGHKEVAEWDLAKYEAFSKPHEQEL
eukprot:TRINITY_DN7274_c0_g1_i6.p1 TRINITY_DN7274_c0_g1~~TRINITY_DN7274_c0_g1_i6.p1  ORF type:complete len:136 (-),score=32.84 TRINITY_DN7274_c0_g1_i6:461-811(-)